MVPQKLHHKRSTAPGNGLFTDSNLQAITQFIDIYDYYAKFVELWLFLPEIVWLFLPWMGFIYPDN